MDHTKTRCTPRTMIKSGAQIAKATIAHATKRETNPVSPQVCVHITLYQY